MNPDWGTLPVRPNSACAMTRYERLLAAIYSGIEHPEDWIDALDLLARASGSRAAGLFVVEA